MAGLHQYSISQAYMQRESHLSNSMSIFNNVRLDAASDTDRKGKPSASEITAISANATGTRVVNARLDKTIRVWKCTSAGLADPVVIESSHAAAVTCVAWVPHTDSDFATVGGDSQVCIWKSSGVADRSVTVGENARLSRLSYAADGSLLAVASGESVYVCDAKRDYGQLHCITPGAGVTDVAWLNSGHAVFLVATDDGRILVCHGDSAEVAHTLTGPRSVTCLLVDPKGRYLAAGSREGVVYVWRTEDLMCSGVLAGVDSDIASLACSKDGSHLFVGYGSSNPRVYDSATLELVYEVPGTACSHVAWVPNRQMIVFSEDKNRVMGFGRKDDRTKTEKDREDRERDRERDRARDPRDRDSRDSRDSRDPRDSRDRDNTRDGRNRDRRRW